MVLGKLPPSPNSNANPKPNPDPDRKAIFLGGNFPDTPLDDCFCKLVLADANPVM